MFSPFQFIPVTYSPDTDFSTMYPPFYNFRENDNEPETFESSDEKFEGFHDGKLRESFDEKFNGKFNENEIYNEHFKENLPSSFDRSDGHTEKNYYKNHVHSPFA